MAERVLVAGIGNIFLSDDGFGCEVAQRMLTSRGERTLPEGVRVVGCRPADMSEGIGLSPAVAAAVDQAVTTVPSGISDQILASLPAARGR